MLTESEALKRLQDELALPVKASALYHNVYLFRVEFPSEAEKDFDPFFSVDISTEEVRDFSILTDGNISEIVNLEWKEM